MPRSINPVPQYFTAENKILVGGLMYYFDANTNDPKDTFADVGETIKNQHPVVLDSEGRLPNVFFSGTAKQVLKDSDNIQIWERDNVEGGLDLIGMKTALINDLSQAYEFTSEGALLSFAIIFPVGKVLNLKDRGARFIFALGGTSNGLDVLDAGNGNTAVLDETDCGNIRKLGAVQNVDMKSVIDYANGLVCGIVIPVGDWLVNNVTITNSIVFKKGGVISGSGIVISGDIHAQPVKIFNSTQDFRLPSDFSQNTDFKVSNQNRVFIDWFGAERADNTFDVKQVAECSLYWFQALRAIGGDFIDNPSRPGGKLMEFRSGSIGLATGSYRVEQQLYTGTSSAGVGYWSSGLGCIGNGVSKSYIVATKLNFGVGESVLNIGRFQGEVNAFSDFKVLIFDEDAPDPFAGEQAAVIFVGPGDSAQFGNIWAAGAQQAVDKGDGFLRNGAGWQFQSCIDIQCSNIFSERNAYNYAFYSCTASFSNMVGFANEEANILFGIANELFSYPQGETDTVVNVSSAEWHGLKNDCTLVVEKGSCLNASNVKVDGTAEVTLQAQGNSFIRAINDSSIRGSIRGLFLRDFTKALARSEDSAKLGGDGNKLTFTDGEIYNMTSSVSTGSPGIISTGQSSSIDNDLSINGYSMDNTFPQLLHFNGVLSVDDITLTGYRGTDSNGVARGIFTIGTSIDSRISNIRRIDNLGQPIAQYGFIGSGNLAINGIEGFQNINRSIFGAGTVTMYDVVQFV